MIKALVIDIQDNVASVLLDDDVVIDVEVNYPVSIGEDITLSPYDLENTWGGELPVGGKPTFDW